jgi:hypothetical protein
MLSRLFWSVRHNALLSPTRLVVAVLVVLQVHCDGNAEMRAKGVGERIGEHETAGIGGRHMAEKREG